MQQIYKRTPMPKCDFNKVALSTLLKSHFGMGVKKRYSKIMQQIYRRKLMQKCDFNLKLHFGMGVLF